MEDILYGLIGDIYWRKDIGCVDIDYDNILIHKNENLNKILDTSDNNNIGVLNNINIFKLSDYGLNYSLVSILNSISDKSDLVIKIFGSDGYILLAHDLVNNSINKMLINRTKPLYITSYYRGITKDNNNIFKYIEGIKDVCKYNNINILNCEEMALDIEKPDLLVNIVGIVNTIKEEIIEENDIIVGFEGIGIEYNRYKLINTLLKKYHCNMSILQKLCLPDKCYYNEINELLNENVVIKKIINIDSRGFYNSINSVLPNKLKIELYDWEFDTEYKFIMDKTGWCKKKMLDTFSGGYGLVLIINKNDYLKINEILDNYNIITKYLGKIIK